MLDYDETNDNFTSQTGSLGAKRTYASSPWCLHSWGLRRWRNSNMCKTRTKLIACTSGSDEKPF
jgi:hypothetical protein